jgi:transposase
LQREFARAPLGEIIEDIKRGQKFERVNVIGSLCNGEHFSVQCYRQATNSAFFETWFANNFLVGITKGYTVIMDNARFHRKKELLKLARGKARLLFLPPYSPDYNPIEKTWANMKRFLCNNLTKFNSVYSGILNYFDSIDI